MYQLEPALHIAQNLINNDGLDMALMMPRQTGKNQIMATIESLAAIRGSQATDTAIITAPTLDPQANISKARIMDILSKWPITAAISRANKRGLSVGAYTIYVTGLDQKAEGMTATRWMHLDEAQDADPETFDRKFRPMTANTHAPVIMTGTPWTSSTLLAQTIEALRQEEKRDGRKRVFVPDVAQIMEEVPPWRMHVEEQIRRLGREHPIIQTQYLLNTVDTVARLITDAMLEQMRGHYPHQDQATPGQLYAMTIDPGGSGADPTAVLVARVHATGALPKYDIARRYTITQTATTREVLDQLNHLIDLWQPSAIAVDTTGLGAPICDMLHHSQITRVTFTPQTKSELGYDLTAAILTGRIHDHGDATEESAEFERQAAATIRELKPDGRMTWGAPPPKHDDHIAALALLPTLDGAAWRSPDAALPYLITAQDPLP